MSDVITIDILGELLSVAGYDAGDMHDTEVCVAVMGEHGTCRIRRVYSPTVPNGETRYVVIEVS